MLEGLRKRLRWSQTDQEAKLKQLTKEVESLQHRSNQLYEAVEKGLLTDGRDVDCSGQQIQAQRQALLIEIAGLRRLKQMPVDALGEKKVQAFTAALRERLIEKDRAFSKNYLKLLVDEIRYLDKQLVMKGSYAALARMVGETKKGTPESGVPSFGLGWLPGQDSNLRPAG
jgi:site-specific DNA recombinase